MRCTVGTESAMAMDWQAESRTLGRLITHLERGLRAPGLRIERCDDQRAHRCSTACDYNTAFVDLHDQINARTASALACGDDANGPIPKQTTSIGHCAAPLVDDSASDTCRNTMAANDAVQLWQWRCKQLTNKAAPERRLGDLRTAQRA